MSDSNLKLQNYKQRLAQWLDLNDQTSPEHSISIVKYRFNVFDILQIGPRGRNLNSIIAAHRYHGPRIAYLVYINCISAFIDPCVKRDKLIEPSIFYKK